MTCKGKNHCRTACTYNTILINHKRLKVTIMYYPGKHNSAEYYINVLLTLILGIIIYQNLSWGLSVAK